MTAPNGASARAALSASTGEVVTLAGGRQLALRRWGEGRPVVGLHAVGHGSGDFAPLADLLPPGFALVAVDWPGMGRSPGDGAPVRAGRFAALALEVCDRLDLRRPIVIGDSIGGAAALLAAARAPERFAGLVLCNPGGLAPVDPAARAVIGAMAAFFRAGAAGAPWFPTAFAAYYRRLVLTKAPARAQRERIIGAARELAPLLADAWDGFRQPDADLRAAAAGLRLPVWFAWAQGDLFVSWSRARAAAERVPHGTVTLFPGGHCAFLETPAAFAEGFAAFAATLEAY